MIVRDGLLASAIIRLAVTVAMSAVCLASLAAAVFADDDAPLPPLVSVETVRALGFDEIARGVRVRLRGVVTFSDGRGAAAVQENAHGLWLRCESTPAKVPAPVRQIVAGLLPGAAVEVTGVLDRGAYAPTLLIEQLTVVGTAELPPPAATDYSRLYGGVDNGSRVAVLGIVQGYRDDGRQWNLIIESASRRFAARVAKATLPLPPQDLVDAEVRLVGVLGAIRNTKGEFLRPALCIAQAAEIQVLVPPKTAAFDAPLVPLESICQFRPSLDPGHRICTSGMVTLSVPGKFFYLQKGLDGVRVETPSQERLLPGDVVEVSGFIRMDRNIGGLTEAVFRKTGHEQPPAALQLQPDDILAVNVRAREISKMARPGSYHGCLVRCEGTLVEVRPPLSGRCRLMVDSGDTIMTASLPDNDLGRLRSLQPGSGLQLTGIAELNLDSEEETPLVADPTPDRVDLLMRSADDIVVVSVPSWWTAKRLGMALAVAAGGLVLSVLWATLLRRQVARQAASLAAEMQSRHDAEIDHQAALRERNRLAANLHDTVLQTITGVGFQLKVCKAVEGRPTAVPGREDDHPSPEQGARISHIDVAQRMVTHAIQQLRGTVWALHSMPPSDRSFPAALRAVAERLGDGHDTTIRVRAEERAFEDETGSVAMPEVVAGNVLLVVQEAVHNALRHANAATIDVTASLTGGDTAVLTVTVRDDGVGFEPDAQAGAALGHFGLEGMRDRAERLGGSLAIESRKDGGTTITARVPIGTAILPERPMAADASAAPINR
jgi:signal transduction histidine kinase